MFLYFGGCLLLPIKTPKKYIIFNILAALLFFCIGLYGIHLATRKVEPFTQAIGGSCGTTTCSGDKPYCRVTEQTLPDNTIDQTLIFNSFGRYVQIVPPETSGDGVVQLSHVLVYDSTGANLALGKPVTASCTQPNVLIGLPTADSSQIVQVPRTFARYVRIRPSTTSDGVMKIQQIMIMNKSGDNVASAAQASAYATTSTGKAISTIIDGNSTPKPSADCWTSNKDTTYNAEYVEIDLKSSKPVTSIEYVGPTDDTNNRIKGLRFELSMYSLKNGETNVIPNSLTVDGTVVRESDGVVIPRTDPSKVCMLGDGTRTAPVWEVDLGQSKFITSVRYVGRTDSGDDINNASNNSEQNSLPGRPRNVGVRFRVLESKTEVATKGTCDKIPDLDNFPYPTGTTPFEKIILKSYILKGIDLNKAKCIFNKIQQNATPDMLIGCGLTELQVVNGFAKMKYTNLQLLNSGPTTSGSWQSGSKTITITSGSFVPYVGMTIADTPTPVRSVAWSISGRTVTNVNGNTITVDKAMTDTGTVTFKFIKLSNTDFAKQVDSLKGLNVIQDIKFDKEECMTRFKKNNIQSIDTTPSPSSAPGSGSGSGSLPLQQPTSQMDDGSKAATDIFVHLLIPKRRDPNATYSQSLTDPDLFTPITDNWAVSATGNLSSTPPITDAQIDQAAGTFSVDRMTVPQSDMDNAAGNTTSSYVPLTPGYASTRKVEPEVFFVGGNFASKEVAEKICKDMEGNLATPIQLRNAWRRGAQWCEPGWVSMTSAQASDAKTAINALITQWESSGYETHMVKYNEVIAKKRVYDSSLGLTTPNPYETGRYNPKDLSMFYDQTGEGVWLPLASTYIVERNGKADLSSLSRDYPWLKTYEIRYGYEPAWISRTLSATAIANIEEPGQPPGIFNINGVTFKNLFPTDPNPTSDLKYLELKLNKPSPGFDTMGYTSKSQMVENLNTIGNIQAGLTVSTVANYKEFPAQIPDTIPKHTKPKELTAFDCQPKQVCPSGYSPVIPGPIVQGYSPATPTQFTQCCKNDGSLNIYNGYQSASLNNNKCFPIYNARLQDGQFYIYTGNIYSSEDLGPPVPANTIYTNCVCPTGYLSEMVPPMTSTNAYNTKAQIPVKCRSTGPCDQGYSPFTLLTGEKSNAYCVKDTCDPGYVDTADGKCVSEYYKNCGTTREVVNKSSMPGGAGAVCYGKKPSRYASSVTLPEYDLSQTYQLNKTGRYVRIWPATRPNKSVGYIESFQVGVDTERMQVTTSTNTTSPAPTVPPNITCKAGFKPVAVSNINNNNPIYICVTQQCDPGYKKTERGCVYESHLSLSQIVIKDSAGNNISKGKNIYAFPSSQEGTNPKNLVNGNETVLSVLDANNGWLSPVYFDGQLDTFLQIDLEDNIEIGSITIYGNTSTKGAYPIMKGTRIEVSKYPRPLPFSNYRNTQVWHDTAAYVGQPCPANFYRKDCGDGLGAICIIEGMGCPKDCPPGLTRDTQGQAGKPATNACVFNMRDLTKFQELSRLGVAKSDFYKVNGTFDDAAYTTAMVNAYKTGETAWNAIMRAIHITTQYTNCQAENNTWIPNSILSNQNKMGALAECQVAQKGVPYDPNSKAAGGGNYDFFGVNIPTACFPADALVTVRNLDSPVAMCDLKIGDEVLTAGGVFSAVYFFGHRNAFETNEYVNLMTKSATIRLSPEHYIPVEDTTLAARQVVVGDKIWAKGKLEPVLEIKITKEVGQYNPYTMENTLIVDGVLASCCSESDEVPVESMLRMFISCDRTISRIAPSIYYAAFAPFRVTFLTNGAEWQQKYSEAMGEKTAYKDLSLWKLVVNALTV